MLKPQGYLTIMSDGPLVEKDTFTCKHCNTVVIVEPAPKPMPGGRCTLCDALVCDACADKPCRPFEKWLEKMESRDRLLRSIGV